MASRIWNALCCALAAAVIGTSSANAQLPAPARWQERESLHFRITYEPELEPLAVHAAAVAERAYAALSRLVADAPSGRIDIVLADNFDLSNGYATPFPSNRIVLYAKPPVDVLELQYTRDWLELVVTHELAHIFHLDAAGWVGRVLRTVFGRVPLPWPAFPALGTPGWSVEGLAVGVESSVTGFGRVHGSYHEMVVRAAALAGELDEYDRLGSSSARWPGGARIYIYGSLFMDYLARRYGADAPVRMVSATAGAIIPPPLWFDRVGRAALGVTFREAYSDWQHEVRQRADSVAGAVRKQGLTSGEALSTHGAIALHPRFSPDSRRIAYAAYDWRSPPALRVIEADGGAERWRESLNVPGPASWLDEASVVVGDIDFVSRFHVFGDLGARGRIERSFTRGARLQEPDARGGVIVAVQNSGGTNRLVTLDAASGEIRPLTEFAADVHWSLPRISPDGSRVAAGRWRSGGSYDIVVLDLRAGRTTVVFSGPGINAAPAWSPDGRWLVFWSDRSGIANLYAVDPAGGGASLRQITNVLTGAYFPDVSPDGRWIAYSRYDHDGFTVERMPFDPRMWRAPGAAPAASALTARHTYEAPAEPLIADVESAFARADTSVGDARGYRPLRSLWPRFWMPIVQTDDTDAWYYGIWSFGRDLVGRHEWDAHAAVAPSSGRTRGAASYRFAGLPELRSLGLHPTPGITVSRDWEEFLPRAEPGGFYIDEREDAASLSLSLARQRWRSAAGVTVAGEFVHRTRKLLDAPGLALVDPDDDLLGALASVYYSRYVSPPLSISRESGVTLQVTGRQRWDQNVRDVEQDDGSLARFDGSYRELTTWNAAYLTLPLPGFARHVLGLRGSALVRDGPGAAFSTIGGAGSTGAATLPIGVTLGASARLLPVRGFPRGARAGTRAWTASLEYRFPLLLIDRPVRPFFADRLSGAIFGDAGHAWCDRDTAARVSPAFCPSSAAGDSPLVSIGAETTLLVGILGFAIPVRVGAALPVRGVSSRSPRPYLATGASF
jgi:hypothetical protein